MVLGVYSSTFVFVLFYFTLMYLVALPTVLSHLVFVGCSPLI